MGELRFPPNVTCEHCGSSSTDLGDTTWRCAGDHWQHRCKDVHPQVGHWRVDPTSTPRSAEREEKT